MTWNAQCTPKDTADTVFVGVVGGKHKNGERPCSLEEAHSASPKAKNRNQKKRMLD